MKYWTKRAGVWVQTDVGDIDVKLANLMVFCGECEHVKPIYGGMYGAVSDHRCKASVIKVKHDYFQATPIYARCRHKNALNNCSDFEPKQPKTPPKPTERPPIPENKDPEL